MADFGKVGLVDSFAGLGVVWPRSGKIRDRDNHPETHKTQARLSDLRFFCACDFYGGLHGASSEGRFL